MTKLAAFGTELRRSGVEIAQVRNITGPGLSADTEDVTTHDNANAWREFISLFLDGGEVTAELIFDPDAATHTSLRTDFVNRTAQAYAVAFSDPTPAVWSFNAFVTALGPAAPVDGALTMTVTLKITGAVTFA